ncbi:MAG: PEGA domain-containing protein, partial [Myxococcota bacterium]
MRPRYRCGSLPEESVRRVPREATHIDIAVALGVGPAPPVESPTVRPDGPPSPSVNAPLLPSKSLPQVLNDIRQESARRRARQAMKVDSADLARSVATTESVSRVIPAVLMVLLLISSAMVGTLLLSGRPKAQEHVELRFLTLRGQPQAAVPSDTPSRVSIATDPPGILVLHEREILGKTPVNLDLPVQLADRVGIELSSPYFERWVGEVTPDDAGAYRVQVELKRRD